MLVFWGDEPLRNYSDPDLPKKTSFRLAWPFFLRPARPAAPQTSTARTLTKEEMRRLFSADLATPGLPGGRRSSEG